MSDPAHPTHPRAIGAPLYDPAFEHDACGIALVADLKGRRSHRLVGQALAALEHLAHRGATGAEVATGDGAGILVQLPHRFLAASVPFDLPEPGGYATGTLFLPDRRRRRRQGPAPGRGARPRGGPAGARLAPRAHGAGGPGGVRAARAMPRICQVVLAPSDGAARRNGALADAEALVLDRLAFCLRKRIEHEVHGDLRAVPVGPHPRLQGDAHRPPAARVLPRPVRRALRQRIGPGAQSRFSTNTFPSWPLAHPYRYVAHNGEINTLRGQPQLDARPGGACSRAI